MLKMTHYVELEKTERRQQVYGMQKVNTNKVDWKTTYLDCRLLRTQVKVAEKTSGPTVGRLMVRGWW